MASRVQGFGTCLESKREGFTLFGPLGALQTIPIFPISACHTHGSCRSPKPRISLDPKPRILDPKLPAALMARLQNRLKGFRGH